MKKILTKLSSGNLASEVWASLRNFRDASYCEELIRSRHNLGRDDQADNIRKQALQVGQCLRQAEEYFDASRVVGPATKPNLLYYGMVSLGLASVLLNRSGEYSLDRLRAQIPHRHGFDLVGFSKLDPTGSPTAVLEQINCKPCDGMFPIWYESLSPDPVIGKFTTILPGLISNAGLGILSPGNELAPFASLSGKAVSAVQLFRQIPDMLPFLADTGVAPNVCRGDFSLEINESGNSYRFTIAAPRVLR